MRRPQTTMQLKYLSRVGLAVALWATSMTAMAQEDGYGDVIDKIVAKVDNHIVLLSDVETVYMSWMEQGVLSGVPTDQVKCQALEAVVSRKMMLAKAEIDSVEVLDAEVDIQLEQRMQQFLGQSGLSAAEVERHYGKSVDQLQDEWRDDMKEQLVMQRMSGIIQEGVTITPSEVKKFFSTIPRDSIPYFDEEVEVSQIVKIIEVGKPQKIAAERKLEDLREQIVGGMDFAVLATKYSQDPGSARTGGELPGWYRRGELAPEFEAACFRLQPGEISEPVETQFGFHLIELLERRGAEFRARHILLTAKPSIEDVQRTKKSVDSLRTEIIDKELSFEKLATEESDDQMTAPSGGFLKDPATGSNRIPLPSLEPTVYFILDQMEVGDISESKEYRTFDGKDAIRILYYKSKIPPHQASLKDDWQKIQAAALSAKQQEEQSVWLRQVRDEVFIQIVDDYKRCNILQ